MHEQAAALFGAAKRREDEQKEVEELQAQLYQQIGQLKVELDNSKISVSRQCELLELARPSATTTAPDPSAR